MKPINIDERRRRRAARKARNKQTVKDILVAAGIAGLIIAGGYHQRGYWSFGAELFLILPVLAFVIARRYDWKI